LVRGIDVLGDNHLLAGIQLVGIDPCGDAEAGVGELKCWRGGHGHKAAVELQCLAVHTRHLLWLTVHGPGVIADRIRDRVLTDLLERPASHGRHLFCRAQIWNGERHGRHQHESCRCFHLVFLGIEIVFMVQFARSTP
jgi:hypothetical protein